MYSELRCGLIHGSGPGTIIVTQNKKDPFGTHSHKKHPNYLTVNGKKLKVFVIEYFYFDFVEACKKVLSMKFKPDDKMNEEYLRVGPLDPLSPRITFK